MTVFRQRHMFVLQEVDRCVLTKASLSEPTSRNSPPESRRFSIDCWSLSRRKSMLGSLTREEYLLSPPPRTPSGEPRTPVDLRGGARFQRPRPPIRRRSRRRERGAIRRESDTKLRRWRWRARDQERPR